MAQQLFQFYSNSDGSTASLIWDDVAMTSSGVQVHVPEGAATVLVDASLGGNPISLTYPGGTDTVFSFGSDLPIALVTTWRGQPGMSMPWLDYISLTVNGG